MRKDEDEDHTHEHEDEEPLPEIPPLQEISSLMRGQCTEWQSQDLPLTPEKSSLVPVPPASWMPEEDAVSLELRHSSEEDSNGSASPEPLMEGPGAAAVLRANGVYFPVEKKEATSKDEQEGDALGKPDDHDDTRNTHAQDKEHDDQEKEEDDSRTQHYSPKHVEQEEEQGDDQEEEEGDEQEEEEGYDPEEEEESDDGHDAKIPLVLHREQRVLRRPAGQAKNKKQPKAAAKAKAKAKSQAKAKAKGKAKAKAGAKATEPETAAPENAADAPPKKKGGWPKGKAKAKAKQVCGPPKRKDPPADDKKDEAEKDSDDAPAKRPKKGVCLVTPEQKKHLKSSLGNMYCVLCMCVNLCGCLLVWVAQT